MQAGFGVELGEERWKVDQLGASKWILEYGYSDWLSVYS